MLATYKDKFNQLAFSIGEFTNLSIRSIYCSVTRPIYFSKVMEQIVQLGIGSISISMVIGLIMGSVMALQFGYGLQKFGGTLYIPKIVSLSLTREMAPIFTSLLVAGRIGSGIAAEIGSMNVTEQVDALRALGTSPIRILIVPRLIAALISLPLLTVLADTLGVFGAMCVSYTEFDISFNFFISSASDTVKVHDFFSGLFKTFIFAFIIVITASVKGLKTTDGTRGVGKSTTWVVVVSSICILLSDFLMSKIFLIFWTH